MKRSLLLPALVVLTGCATTTAPTTRFTAKQLNSDSYATLYLGANGTVVTKTTKAGHPQAQGYWHGEGVSGRPSIVIDLTRQEADYYKGGQLIGMSPVSTGREGYDTPTGSFSVIEKDIDHLSNRYGNYVDSSGNVVVHNVGLLEDRCPAGAHFVGAPMPYFMRVTNGVGMHEGFLPGVADSHGCIRMPEEMAKIFYENTPVGTPVRIVR